MTKMKKRLFPLILLPSILVSCNGNIPLEVKLYSDYLSPLETYKEERGDIYYRNNRVNTLKVEKIDKVNIKTKVYEYSSLNDVSVGSNSKSYSSFSNDINNPNNYIEQNLLVVPISFTDSPSVNNEKEQEDKRTLLTNAFFGDSAYTNYESVASYYNKSSYGHLRIKGEVLPFFSISQSSLEAEKEAKNSPETYSDKIAKMIVDSLDEETFNKYSNNHEGVLDALYIIYDYPYKNEKHNNENSLFWAYTYHCEKSDKVSNYSWSSFDFLGKDALITHKVDANIFIHEMGHQFGLLDYYNKGSYSYYQPLGFFDMMDYNLGDHSPLSKYLLNWTTPYVLDMGDKSEGDIYIRPFSQSGDFILIPLEDYNNTPYDRYLLVSYFSPTGLNDPSNFSNYIYRDKNGDERIFSFLNNYGVMVHEVNAKLGYYEYNAVRRSTPSYFINETPKSGDYIVNFYYDNELNSSSETPFYHLLESSGTNSFIEGRSANNDTLFGLNASFGKDTFIELSNEFKVSFTVTGLSTNGAKITFYKK